MMKHNSPICLHIFTFIYSHYTLAVYVHIYKLVKVYMVSADSMECYALSEILPRRDEFRRKKALLSGKGNTKLLNSANWNNLL
jgi:hypothetical protein